MLEFDAQILAGKRVELATARIVLRKSIETEELTRAIAERQAIAAAGGAVALGSNETDRKRALTLALAEDGVYAGTCIDLAHARDAVERLTAEIAALEDLRRELDRASRDRLSEALLSCSRIPRTFATTDDLAGVLTS